MQKENLFFLLNNPKKFQQQNTENLLQSLYALIASINLYLSPYMQKLQENDTRKTDQGDQ